VLGAFNFENDRPQAFSQETCRCSSCSATSSRVVHLGAVNQKLSETRRARADNQRLRDISHAELNVDSPPASPTAAVRPRPGLEWRARSVPRAASAAAVDTTRSRATTTSTVICAATCCRGRRRSPVHSRRRSRARYGGEESRPPARTEAALELAEQGGRGSRKGIAHPAAGAGADGGGRGGRRRPLSNELAHRRPIGAYQAKAGATACQRRRGRRAAAGVRPPAPVGEAPVEAPVPAPPAPEAVA
jgi:hypothetical protein